MFFWNEHPFGPGRANATIPWQNGAAVPQGTVNMTCRHIAKLTAFWSFFRLGARAQSLHAGLRCGADANAQDACAKAKTMPPFTPNLICINAHTFKPCHMTPSEWSMRWT